MALPDGNEVTERESEEMQKQSLGVPTLEHEGEEALGIRN